MVALKNCDLSDEFWPRSYRNYVQKYGEQDVNNERQIEKQLFVSDDEVKIFVNNLEKEKYENFYQRDAQFKNKKIKNAEIKKANPSIKYHSITYRCIFGKQEEFKGTALGKHRM